MRRGGEHGVRDGREQHVKQPVFEHEAAKLVTAVAREGTRQCRSRRGPITPQTPQRINGAARPCHGAASSADNSSTVPK